jgi:hypothetical protein
MRSGPLGPQSALARHIIGAMFKCPLRLVISN